VPFIARLVPTMHFRASDLPVMMRVSDNIAVLRAFGRRSSRHRCG
jgi:hypothetical protein